jgi:hypothetical protein
LTPVNKIGPENPSLWQQPSKPYAKTKVGESCTCMMFIDSLMVVHNEIEIPGIHFQYQNNGQ